MSGSDPNGIRVGAVGEGIGAGHGLGRPVERRDRVRTSVSGPPVTSASGIRPSGSRGFVIEADSSCRARAGPSAGWSLRGSRNRPGGPARALAVAWPRRRRVASAPWLRISRSSTASCWARRAPRPSPSGTGGSSRSAAPRSRTARRRPSTPGAGSSCPASTTRHIHLRSGARESNGALLYPLETLAEVQAAIRRHADANPRRAVGPRPRLAVCRLPGRDAHRGPARRGHPRPPGVDGLLRRPHGLGEHAGDAPGGRRSRHAGSAGRRDRPGRRRARRPARSRRTPRR